MQKDTLKEDGFFNTNTSIKDDILICFRLNGFLPNDKYIQEVYDDLQSALKDGRHVLKVLDEHIAEYRIKTPNKRNLRHENILRVMREKGLTREEAIDKIRLRGQARKDKEAAIHQHKQWCWNLQLPEDYALEDKAQIGVVTSEGLFQFQNASKAAIWIQEKYNYKEYVTARVTTQRHLKNGTPNVQNGFRLFYLKKN